MLELTKQFSIDRVPQMKILFVHVPYARGIIAAVTFAAVIIFSAFFG